MNTPPALPPSEAAPAPTPGPGSRLAMLAAHVDASAQLLGLPLTPGQREGVIHYFGIAARMAELVQAVPLTVHDEPAPAFVPVSPQGA